MQLINRLKPIRRRIVKQSAPAPQNTQPRPHPHPPTAAIDFDGTIAEYREDLDLAKTVLRDGARRGMRQIRDAGIRLIVWTGRPDIGEVSAWLTEQGIPFDEINNNSAEDNGSRKIQAGCYVDDHGINADRDWEEIIGKVLEMLMGKPSQPAAESYDDLASKAGQAQGELAELLDRLGFPTYNIADLELGQLEEILRQPGGAVLLAPVKTQQRAEEKVEAEYDGDWTRLLDMVRGAVAVDTMEQIQGAIGTLNGLGAKYARMPKDRFREPLKNGYRDYLVNYRLPGGMVCEVQFHLKPMLIARERAKMSYDVARAIKASMEEEGRDEMTPAEAEACRRARKAAEHAYALAWDECRRNDPTLVDKTVNGEVQKVGDAEYQNAGRQLSNLGRGRVIRINGHKIKRDKLGYFTVDNNSPTTGNRALDQIFPEGYVDDRPQKSLKNTLLDAPTAAAAPGGPISKLTKGKHKPTQAELDAIGRISSGYATNQDLAMARGYGENPSTDREFSAACRQALRIGGYTSGGGWKKSDGPTSNLSKGGDPATWTAPGTESLPQNKLNKANDAQWQEGKSLVSKLEGPQYTGDAPAENLKSRLAENKDCGMCSATTPKSRLKGWGDTARAVGARAREQSREAHMEWEQTGKSKIAFDRSNLTGKDIKPTEKNAEAQRHYNAADAHRGAVGELREMAKQEPQHAGYYGSAALQHDMAANLHDKAGDEWGKRVL